MNWHARYLQQANWTRPLRAHLFRQAGLARARRLLEVGCGTGALLTDLTSPANLHGLDIDPSRLAQARLHAPAALLTCADAHALPYPSNTFDLTFCHFLLLWLKDPLQALQEMKRVTRPGGFVLAFAEPDHTRRLDQPPSLAPLGQLQTSALLAQGANPALGASLAALFHQTGLKEIASGTLQPLNGPPTARDHALEWEVLADDLQNLLSPAELLAWQELDRQACLAGTRRLHVPTLYAYGVV